MSKGTYYTKTEWETAEFLSKRGKSWSSIGKLLKRSPSSLADAVAKGSYEAYRKKVPQRKTEQLQFLPPEVPKKKAKKIPVKYVGVDEKLEAELRIIKKERAAIRHFFWELKDARTKS